MPHWLNEEIWSEYLGHREDMRKPLTDRAQRMTLRKLEGMAAKGLDPNEALMNSIMNGWQGVFEYEVKRETNRRSGEYLSAVDRARAACGIPAGEFAMGANDGNLRPQMGEQLRHESVGNVVEGAFRVVGRRA